MAAIWCNGVRDGIAPATFDTLIFLHLGGDLVSSTFSIASLFVSVS